MVVGPSKCDKYSKPAQQQECFNDRCVGKWKAGPWSEVSEYLNVFAGQMIYLITERTNEVTPW